MMLMQIVPAFSLTSNNVNFGFAPVLGFGSLSINYDEDPTKVNEGVLFQSKRLGLFGSNVGGEALEKAFGFKLGFSFDVDESFRFGGTFISPLKYEYKNIVNFEQFTLDGMMFEINKFITNDKNGATTAQIDALLNTANGMLGTTFTADNFSELTINQLAAAAPTKENLDNLVLEQPWEVAFGLAYKPKPALTVTMDFRHIAWGETEGYGEFGWDNQNVMALGVEYKRGKISIRGGYNYAESPLKPYELEGDSFGINLIDIQGHQIMRGALDMLNMVGFPAISTTHYTFGFGYAASRRFEWNFAAVISPETKTSRKGYYNPLSEFSALGVTTAPLNYEYTTTMIQNSYTMNVMYHF
jgi:long-chain fatty acid transport protein